MKLAFYARKMRCCFYTAATAMGIVCAQGAFAHDVQPDDLMVVFDASGSMWGQVDGTTKIEIARDVFTDLAKDWSAADRAVGLIAYGHRRKGDCGDIEMLAEPSIEGAAALAEIVEDLSPRGKTPLSEAVRMAAETLRYTENAATVVLLSDGRETCDLDPCVVGSELEELGVDFTAHVIGFDIQEETDRTQLQCLAHSTGGTYVDASDARTLSEALTRVVANDVEQANVLATTAYAHLTLVFAEGTTRPSDVKLTATDAASGEVRNLGRLTGADQVLSGLKIDLPQGDWTFSAEGDGGSGKITVVLSKETQEVSIPFAASAAAFELTGADSFAVDGTITIQLRSLKPLQQNATYNVVLVPQGATDFAQNITFTYRFGTDPETTEHYFNPWEYDLPVGTYEVVVIKDGEDLTDNLGRLAFQLIDEVTETDQASDPVVAATPVPDFGLSQRIEPLSPGVEGALGITGPVMAGDQVMFIGLDGQDTAVAAVSGNGLVAVPPQIATGVYRLELLRADGTDFHLDVVDILPDGAQSIGDHGTSGEAPETMLSDAELAAETGPQELAFTPWKNCDDAAPCRVADRRVGLDIMLPAGWALEEPFYYTTAGGARAANPTAQLARVNGGAFKAFLNPRQWDAQLGPCEDVVLGQLCHEATDALQDQTDLELIRNSLNGDFPRPNGWLPIGRSWTVEDRILGRPVGLLNFEEPAERAPTVTVYFKLNSATQFGITDTTVAQADLGLLWDDGPIITAIDGSVAFNGGGLFINLSRPGDWDGTTDVWTGQIVNPENDKGVLVILY